MKSYTETNKYKPQCPEFRTNYCYDTCNWFGTCPDFDDEDKYYEENEKLMNKIDVGTTVMLCVAHVNDIPDELKALDQRLYRVKSVTEVSKSWRYYELKGCVSKAGVPWCIEESWIQPIREIKR